MEDDLSSELEAQLVVDDVEDLVLLLFPLMETDQNRTLSELKQKQYKDECCIS